MLDGFLYIATVCYLPRLCIAMAKWLLWLCFGFSVMLIDYYGFGYVCIAVVLLLMVIDLAIMMLFPGSLGFWFLSILGMAYVSVSWPTHFLLLYLLTTFDHCHLVLHLPIA